MKADRGIFLSAISLLFLLGLFLVLSSYQLEIWTKIPYNIGAVELGAGLISISVGGLALYLSLGSDKRMKAMANLEFYEKMAVIEKYKSQVDSGQPVVVEALYYDIKATKQIEEYVKPEIKRELNCKTQQLIAIASQKPAYAYLVTRLQDVQKEDC